MAIKRADVEKFAEEHGIELEITEFPKNKTLHGRAGINHVHAYTKTGEVFGTSDLHNLSVWDLDCAVAINWADVLADLCDHAPVPCPFSLANGGAGCEVCDEESDVDADGRSLGSGTGPALDADTAEWCAEIERSL